MRGVILAGGKGSRLGELTRITNKHLLACGPYPMIYHSIFKMTEVGIRDILIITGTEHMGDFIELLGSGRRLKCNLTYKVQEEAGGIAQALGLAEDFCHDGKRFLVILADNIFQDSLSKTLEWGSCLPKNAWLYLKKVPEASRFGVVEFNKENLVITSFSYVGGLKTIQEKPKNPPSDYAVCGIYVYPPDVFDVINNLKPSGRGELEITDVNNFYIKEGRMGWTALEGYWTDAGTLESWFHANQLLVQHNDLAKHWLV